MRGLGRQTRHPTSAAFADLDNDGDLDLYVCHYMIWDPENPPLCQNDKGDRSTATPARSSPLPTMSSATTAAGSSMSRRRPASPRAGGRGLGVVAADLDDDNRIDLYVANDGTANYLFRNQGNFHFEEVGLKPAWPAAPPADIRPAWASPAATSTATAGPT